MLSRCTLEVLTPELVRRVVTLCATFPRWSQEHVYHYLQSQGVRVSQRQVRQAIEQSGWSTLRQELKRRYLWTRNAFHLKEEWLVQELLRQIQRLLEFMERVRVLSPEERIALADVQGLAVPATKPAKAAHTGHGTCPQPVTVSGPRLPARADHGIMTSDEV